jgi:hypothetical protein
MVRGRHYWFRTSQATPHEESSIRAVAVYSDRHSAIRHDPQATMTGASDRTSQSRPTVSLRREEASVVCTEGGRAGQRELAPWTLTTEGSANG